MNVRRCLPGVLVLLAGCDRLFLIERTDGSGIPPDQALQPAGVAVERYSVARASFTSSLSASHTVGEFTDRIMLVAISVSYSETTATAVTFGATPLTRVGVRDALATDGRVELWTLDDPPSATADVTITLSDANSSSVAGIGSFSGAASLGPFVATTGVAGSPTVTLESTPGDLVLGFVMWNGGDYSSLTSNQPDVRWNDNVGPIVGAGTTAPGASSTSLSWTVVGGFDDYWAAAAVALRP